MTRPRALTLAAGVALATLAAGAATRVTAVAGSARHLHVPPGASIQAAVNSAQPGDVIQLDAGEYREQVVIETDDLTLTGAGADTVIEPPATRQVTDCSQGPDSPTEFQDGICLLAVPTADGDTIEHLTVEGFPDGGVTALGASHLTVDHIVSQGSEFGVFAQGTSGIDIADDTLADNVDIGALITDSASAHATVVHNDVHGNRVGIVADDASVGRVSHNDVHDNCGGIVVENDTAGADSWTVSHNQVDHNTKACPTGSSFPGSPAVSGSGISLQGATHSSVVDNEVDGNQPAFPNKFAGGIDVHSTASSSGGSQPVDDVVSANTLSGNLPDDLRWDGSGSVTFSANRCGTSSPAGLCA